MFKICKCLETKSSHNIDRIIHFDRAVLEGGAFTSFSFYQCMDCLGYCGFPPGNLEIALLKGTQETITMLNLIPKFHSMS